ncbi:hypothetical protein BJ742DRAFT_895487 [Cladochytrium replicatum]|nr:hypothetical protein BJ742DRAFT_895487 [Cladochytrium replicatum]
MIVSHQTDVPHPSVIKFNPPDEKTALLRGRKTTSTSWRTPIKRNSSLLLLFFALAILFTFRPKTSNFLANPFSFSRRPLCSGKGILGIRGNCVCDYPHTGADCSQTVPALSDIENTRLGSSSALLVVDTFGPLNSIRPSSSSFESLALALGSQGWNVTILYIGRQNPHIPYVAKQYRSRSILLEQLPDPEVLYTEHTDPAAVTSLGVMNYLRNVKPTQFAVVYFQASSGAAYFPLVSRGQGTLCTSSKFVVGIDTIGESNLQRMVLGDPSYVSTDVRALKLEYMQQKSVELADAIVTQSQDVLGMLDEQQWLYSVTETHVLKTIPSDDAVNTGRFDKTSIDVQVEELVFIGSLSKESGIELFCDALDTLVLEQSLDATKITFIISEWNGSDLIHNLTAVEYLELRSQRWSSPIQWNLITDLQVEQDIVKYMLESTTTTNSNRVAVIPGTNVINFELPRALYFTGVPVLGSLEVQFSLLPSHGEASSEQTEQTESPKILRTEKLSSFTSIALAEQISAVLWDGVRRPSPDVAAERASLQKSWTQLFSTLRDNMRPPTCSEISESDLMISVVITHRDRPYLLRQAIDSILAQTYTNYEIIVVDDGSSSEEAVHLLHKLAWEWWEEKGWKVLREPRRYVGAARNTGAKHARGKYIVFMDDDDLAKPNQLEMIARVIKIMGEPNVITAGHDLFEGLGSPPRRYAQGAAAKKVMQGRMIPLGPCRLAGMLQNVFGDSHMAVKRDYFMDTGGFTEVFGIGFEDYEFLVRAVLGGASLEAIPEALTWYRRHPDAMSYNTDLQANQMRFLRAYAEHEHQASLHERALLDYTRKRFFARSDSEDLPPLLQGNLTARFVVNTTMSTILPRSQSYVSSKHSSTIDPAPFGKSSPTSLSSSTTTASIAMQSRSLPSLPPITNRAISPASLSKRSTCAGQNNCGDCNQIRTCVSVSHVEPPAIPNTPNYVFRVFGSGFSHVLSQYGPIECILGGVRLPASVHSDKILECKLSGPILTLGAAGVSIRMKVPNDEGVAITTASILVGRVFIYGDSASVTGIHSGQRGSRKSSKTNINGFSSSSEQAPALEVISDRETNSFVTVTGLDLTDTGHVVCIFNVEDTNTTVVAVASGHSNWICDIPDALRSQSGKLYFSLNNGFDAARNGVIPITSKSKRGLLSEAVAIGAVVIASISLGIFLSRRQNVSVKGNVNKDIGSASRPRPRKHPRILGTSADELAALLRGNATSDIRAPPELVPDYGLVSNISRRGSRVFEDENDMSLEVALDIDPSNTTSRSM